MKKTLTIAAAALLALSVLPGTYVLGAMHGEKHVKINVLKNCLVQGLDPQLCLKFTDIITHEQ